MASITHDEIVLLSKYVNQLTGIKLDPEKSYLLESRFQPLLTEFHCNSFRDLYDKAKQDRTGSVINRMIDAITTNETYFFRDKKPFELLSNKIIPDLIDLKRRTSGSSRISLKIWSAACSTGQEMYSIGMTLSEILKDIHRHNISILGTDISDEVISRASYGQYNRFEVDRGLPPHYLNKYFTKMANGWRIKDTIRTMARFEKRDLLKPFNDLGRFDIIFCRNVAIYFDGNDKKNLFRKLGQSLLPGGALLVGASESLTGIANDFVARHYLKSIYYQLKSDTPLTDSPVITDTARPRRPVPPKPVRPAVRPALKPSPTITSAKSAPRVTKAEPPPSAIPKTVPPPAAVEMPAPVAEPEQKQSLLSSIGKKGTGKQSLLSEINSSQSEPKKSLLSRTRSKSSEN